MPGRRRWNGYGHEGEGLSPEAVARWHRTVAPLLGVGPQDYRPPVPLERLRLPEPRLSPKIPAFQGRLHQDPYERALHAAGRSYGDLVRLRTGESLTFPDAVAYPMTEEDLFRLLEYADRERVALVPVGGGSSVTGGVEPLLPPGFAGVISVDLRGLNRLLDLDPLSQMARVQAGILGPELEAALRPHGFAFRFYPQSYLQSTLGGWIAAKAAGHRSDEGIEGQVVALKVVSPRGIVHQRAVPRSAANPLQGLFFGSEGTLGFVTEAVIRLTRPPSRKLAAGFRLPDFQAGLEALAQIAQRGLRPQVVRLLDEEESFAQFLPQGGFRGAFLHLGFELDEESLPRGDASFQEAEGLLERCGGEKLPQGYLEAWREGFRTQPFWRDLMVDHGLLVDTLETAAPWSRVEHLRKKVKEALRQALSPYSPLVLVFARVTHVYPDGCSLYFTFVAKPPREALLEVWRKAQQAALGAFLEAGATLSHHHGIGKDFVGLWPNEVGTLSVEAFKGLKRVLDPGGLLNPGALFRD